MARLQNMNKQTQTFSGFYKSEMFQDGVQSLPLRVSNDTQVMVRILPALNYDNIANEDLFASSYLPFMDSDGELTEWVSYVSGYTGWGELKTSFISPDTVSPRDRVKWRYPFAHTDPLCDLAKFIRFANDEALEEEMLEPITEQEHALLGGKIPVIPAKPRTLALINCLVKQDANSEWSNAIMYLSEAGFKALATRLLSKRDIDSTFIADDKFPNYIFGDITHPETGCVVYGVPHKTESYTAYTLSPTLDIASRDGSAMVRLPVTEEQLAKRYMLSDDETTLKIKTYQDVLDLMCKDPAIPLQTLQKAHAFKVFAKGAVLNLDLRTEGLKIVAERNAKRKDTPPNNTDSQPKMTTTRTTRNTNNVDRSMQSVAPATVNNVVANEVIVSDFNPPPATNEVVTPTQQSVTNTTVATGILSAEEQKFFDETRDAMLSGQIITDIEVVKRYAALNARIAKSNKQ